MNPDFVRRFAPKLLIEKDSAGANASSIDPQGNPRPYIEQGGVREYFGPAAEAGLRGRADFGEVRNDSPIDPQGNPRPYIEQGGVRDYFGPVADDGLRGRYNETQSNDVLRGRYEEAIPEAGLAGPTRLTRPQAGIASRNTAGSPREYVPQDMLARTSMTARIPMYRADVAEDRIMSGIVHGDIDPTFGSPGFNRVMRNPENATLADLLSSFNFQLPSFSGRAAEASTQNSKREKPTNDNYIRNANTLGNMPNFSTSEGLAEFNRRMGLNLTPQVRTQAEQDALRRAGATNAVVSWHTLGQAADISPRQLNGLQGQAAVNEVRRRLISAGYPDMHIIWETGHGRGQGTGPHVHIQPRPGSPRQQ